MNNTETLLEWYAKQMRWEILDHRMIGEDGPCTKNYSHYHNNEGPDCCRELPTIDLPFLTSILEMTEKCQKCQRYLIDQSLYLEHLCDVLGMTHSYVEGYLADPINLKLIHTATIEQRVEALVGVIDG